MQHLKAARSKDVKNKQFLVKMSEEICSVVSESGSDSSTKEEQLILKIGTSNK